MIVFTAWGSRWVLSSLYPLPGGRQHLVESARYLFEDVIGGGWEGKRHVAHSGGGSLRKLNEARKISDELAAEGVAHGSTCSSAGQSISGAATSSTSTTTWSTRSRWNSR